MPDVVPQLAPLLAWRLAGFGGTLCRGVPLAPGVAHLVLGPLARSAVQGVNRLPEVVEVRIPLAELGLHRLGVALAVLGQIRAVRGF